MNPTPTTVPGAKKAVMSQHALLESLVAIATKHFNEQVIGVGTRLVAAFLEASDTADARMVYQLVKAGNLLKENSYAYIHLCSTELEVALRREIEQLVPSLRKLKATSGELSLVSMEEMDTKVTFDTVARPFEFKYASQIATLNVRLGVMLDREILRTSQNPFRPEMFLSVMNQAWREFEPDTESHPLIIPLFKPEVLFDFAPMYDALCDALMKKGAQPGSIDALNIRKTENAAAAKQARAKQKADLARQLRQFMAEEQADGHVDGGIPLIPDLPMLAASGTGGWRPSAAQGFAAAAPAGRDATTGQGAVSAGGFAPAQPGVSVPASGFVPAQPGMTVPAGGFVNAGTHQAAAGQAGQAGQGQPMSAGGFAPAPHGGFAPVAGGGFAPTPGGGFAPTAGGGFAPTAGGGFAPTPGGGFAPMQMNGAGTAALLDLLKNLQAHLPEQMAAPAGPGAASPFGAPLAQHGGAGQAHRIGGTGEPLHGQAHSQAGDGAAAGHDGGFTPAPNVFYLPRLKASIPKGALSRSDEGTIDLLSKIFDTVFIDPNIPREIRELIQFLQIPVLRAALLDKNFFFEETHPARRMIDLMSRIGMEQRKAPDDPLVQAMRRSIDRVGREGDERPDVFAEALADLEQTVKAEEEQAQQAIAAPIAAALKQEKMTAATRSAKSAVAARIGSGEVVAMLETFLENKWTAVLTLAYTVEDEKPGAVNNATKTMDDLIWSVKPKITKEERKALIARLPSLLAALNRWLDVIKWQDAARLQFFAELAECHASIVRAPLDITPERQLEIAVEVAQQDALRRLEKEQQAEAEAPPADIDDAALAIEALERGQWLEFTQPDGSLRKVKLAWISPLRTLFIFSTGAKQEAFSWPVEKLTAAFREKCVKVLRVDVVGRALSEAMGAANGDAGSAAEPAAAAA
ncbi:MAG: DUF1631 family protein [Gammaproteobacteria bacterium]